MGMYTEFLFQGETKANLPHEIKELIYYFFDENSSEIIGSYELPDHPFFKCERWRHIGHIGSYYFSPFCLRYKKEHIQKDGTERVFLICNLKNYHGEIKLFLDWIDPYMEFYWGHYCYEEDEQPTFFKVRR
jgi:hypothetical protein